MKDIKSLFNAAKTSGKEKDVSSYQEAVQEVLQNNPNDYILQLEYIISSSIGLSTFKQFVEKYGLPIACYDNVMACMEKCIDKCEISGENSDAYKEAVAYLESFHQKYINAFAMFEYYKDGLPENYVETYYRSTDKGIQNRMLVTGMIQRFGEAAVPDMIITASQFGDNAMNQLLKYLNECALYTEGAVGAFLGGLTLGGLLLPIIFIGATIKIMSIVDRKYAKKYDNKIKNILAEASGVKAKSIDLDDNEWIKAARNQMNASIDKYLDGVNKSLYKAEKSAEISSSPHPYFTLGVSEYDSSVDKCTIKNLVICSHLATGLIKKNDIKKLADSLNAIDKDIQIAIVDEKCDLPGDDNGGAWDYYIKSGICEGGPEDGPDDETYADWINNQVKNIEKSGYIVVDISLSMTAEKLVKKGTITESFDRTFYEWVYEAAHNLVETRSTNDVLSRISQKSVSAIVESMNSHHHQVFREATIMGDDNAVYEYSDEEIGAIRDLIAFKEYFLTWMDDANPRAIMEYQKEIYSLYEELDGLILEEEDHVGEEKKDTDFVPIFGIIKSYSESKTRSDGTPKSESELNSTKFKHQIKFLTKGDNYSHALVSFDPKFDKLYSYDDDGFVVDNMLEEKSWLSTDSIYICVMFVTKSEKQRMEKYVAKLVENKDKTAYAYTNLLKAYIGKPVKHDKRFVCSTFTSYILQCSNPKNLHRDYSRLRPEDITILPRAFYVMNVKDRLEFNRKKDEFLKRVDEIYKEHQEEIADYNNHLPKIMLKDRMDELSTFDKFFDWLIKKI